MPSFYVVIGTDRLLENTPVFWGEDGAVDPLVLDVCNQVAEGLGLCLDAEAHEHGFDFVVRQEREGHKFFDVSVHCIIVTVGCLETKLLYL